LEIFDLPLRFLDFDSSLPPGLCCIQLVKSPLIDLLGPVQLHPSNLGIIHQVGVQTILVRPRALLVGLLYTLGVQTVPSLGQVDIKEKPLGVCEGDVLLLAELHEVRQEPEVLCGSRRLNFNLASSLKGLLAFDHG